MTGAVVEVALQDAAYAVNRMRNGQTALGVAAYQHYNLLLLGLSPPGEDGHTVLGSLHARDNSVSMLILTAHDAMDGRMHGLDGGADDYILKPFEMAELPARMRAVLRHKGGAASPVLTNGVLTLDPTTHEARIGDAKSVRLFAHEFALLQALMLRPGTILSRTELGERIYDWGYEVASNAVEFLIHALRKKLDTQAIKNIRGVGWMVPRGQ